MATNLPSATSVVSAYTAFAASVMVVKTVLNEFQSITYQIIPQNLQEKFVTKLGKLFQVLLTEKEILTLSIDEQCDGLMQNQIYEAAQAYLSTKINHSNKRLKLSKAVRDKDFSVSIDKGEEILDSFEGITLRWVMLIRSKKSQMKVHRSMELNFHKQHKEKVLGRYIPFVLKTAKRIHEENRVVKLYQLGEFHDFESSINLQHSTHWPMEPEVKRVLIADLDRFVRRRDFYHRVGKVWKRGYLLHEPPGTGKSSLVAAMANYLKFHIYDFDLSKMRYNLDFRQLLVSTSNRSIIVIEDIDCSTNKLQNRQHQASSGIGEDGTTDINYNNEGSGDDHSLPLAGLLNFIDGLWSSCGEERIIVFTTNYKERLDPALIRPGRMDMHIHLSYLTFCHPLFTQIEELIKEVQVTPAAAAEELMKSDDIDEALEGFVQLLLKKKEDDQAQGNL
uniref:AAA+ ATPase domain-containing protein n=1 Tax=Chenopodium quinoa TaxID=63459 RepID=A0A803L1X2_CHEQI